MFSILLRRAYVEAFDAGLVFLVSLLLVKQIGQQTVFVASRLFESLPLLVVGLLAGVSIDKFGPQRVTRYTALAIFLPLILVLSVHFLDAPKIGLVVGSFAIAIITSLLINCNEKLAVCTIPKSGIVKYNADAILVERTCFMLVPPIIGLLASHSVDAAVVGVILFAGAGALILGFKPTRNIRTAPSSEAGWWATLIAGFSALLQSKFHLQLSCLMMLINGIEALPVFYGIAYGHDSLAMNSIQLGLLATASGLGGFLGATVARRLTLIPHSIMYFFPLAFLGMAAANASIYMLGTVSSLLAGTALRSFMFILALVPYRSLRQSTIDPSRFGAISGGMAFLVKAGIPVGAIVGGWLLVTHGASKIYLAASSAELVLAVGTAFWIFSRARRLMET